MTGPRAEFGTSHIKRTELLGGIFFWEFPYLITVQLHHRVLNLDLAFGSHGACLSKVQRRSRSGPAGRRSESVCARKGSRRKRSLGRREGSKRRREKTRRRERGNGRRGRKGPARESGTRPKSVHGVGIHFFRNLVRRDTCQQEFLRLCLARKGTVGQRAVLRAPI